MRNLSWQLMDNITHSSPWAKLLPSLPRSVFTDSLDPFPLFPAHLLQLLRPFVVWANIRWDPLAWALWHPLFSQAGQLALLEDAFPATHTAGITLQVWAAMAPLGLLRGISVLPYL